MFDIIMVWKESVPIIVRTGKKRKRKNSILFVYLTKPKYKKLYKDHCK